MKEHDLQKTPPNIYRFIRKQLPLLLGWAVGSVTFGLLQRQYKNDQQRGLGDQFIGWGAIDGIIAASGMAGMHKNARLLAADKIEPIKHDKDARQFEQVVWVNTVLDIGYILAGKSLVQRNPGNTYRRGMGWGILIQGGFLFLWDLLLALLIRRYRHDNLASS